MKLGVLLDLRCRNFGFFLLNKDMGPLGFENGWSKWLEDVGPVV